MTIKFSDITGGGIPYGNNAGRPANPGIGKLYSNGEEKRLELWTSTGWQNIVSETPGVVSVSGSYLESVGSATIEITGTNFNPGAIASVIGTNGVEVNANSTTVNSIVSVSAVFSGLSSQYEPYDVKLTNTSNLFGLLPDALYINNILIWNTAAGSLGTFADNIAISISATATDDSTITYSLASGSILPSGITLNSSTGLLSGTLPDVLSNTTYTFTINASDGSNPVVPRTFSITVNAAPVWSTAAGSLGILNQQDVVSIQLAATDASDSIVYTLASGSSLPAGLSLSTSGLISGTVPSVIVDSTNSFTVNASDGINISSRAFSIQYLNIDGSTSQKAFSSPTQAALFGTSAGTYYFKGGSMSSAVQLYYSGSNYYDNSSYVRTFSAPYRSAATVNRLGLSIPFKKIMVRRVESDTRGLVRFNTSQVYNEALSQGLVGDSGENNFSSTKPTRVILGTAGGHGIYNNSQAACSWGSTISGSIGAGYVSVCGSYPDDLYQGYNPSDSGPSYQNTSGTFEHWLSW
jgi:Putative Ig domain